MIGDPCKHGVALTEHILSSIHSLNKYLLDAQSVLVTVQADGVTKVNKTYNPCPWELSNIICILYVQRTLQPKKNITTQHSMKNLDRIKCGIKMD